MESSKSLELPRLIWFMLNHFLNGAVMGSICALTLIWFNVGQIGSMLSSVDSALLTSLFIAEGSLLFGTFAASVAVMNIRDDDN